MNDLTNMTNYQRVLAAGFEFPDRIIHLFTGGSALHGAKLDAPDASCVSGVSDIDIFGVYIESRDNILGMDPKSHFVWSTAGTTRQNSPGDVDICLYGLRKFIGLASKGNPSALQFLFAEPDVLEGQEDRQRAVNLAMWNFVNKNRDQVLAVSHYKQFIGYARAQLARMVGERSRNCNRPELVKAYGFDTKFAMHVIRVLLECQELLTTGKLTFPNPDRGLLISIRQGEVAQDQVVKLANRLIEECQDLAAGSTVMQKEIDRQAVSHVIAETYMNHWTMTDYL